MQPSPNSTSRDRRAPHPRYICDQKLRDDLLRVATLLGKQRLSQADYSHFGQHSFITICRRFISWRSALEQIHLQPGSFKNIDAAFLLDDIRKVARRFRTSRLVQTEYIKNGRYSRKIIQRLFGTWELAATSAGLIPVSHCVQRQHRGPRTTNVALPYQILRRDRFRCRACGRSPANHPVLELQVDHIIPWSQGGSTRPENLQTLCNQCNRGKSDSV